MSFQTRETCSSPDHNEDLFDSSVDVQYKNQWGSFSCCSFCLCSLISQISTKRSSFVFWRWRWL